MIVVLGGVIARVGPDQVEAAGVTAAVARGAVDAGAQVQVVTKVGDDPAGDAVLADLARRGIGHAAVVRDPARPTPVEPTAAGSSTDGQGEDGGLAVALSVAEPTEAVRANGRLTTQLALEGADMELALRYLADYRAVVVAGPMDAASASVVAEAASWAGALIVVVTSEADIVPTAFDGATVLAAPPDDPDEVFAGLVGAFAAALDRGEPPATAFRAAISAGGWEPAEG